MTPGPGHNVGGIAVERLSSIVNRIERMEEERKALSSDVRDLYKEAASAGYSVKVLRALVKERAKDATEAAEHEALLDTYRHALAEFVNTPLGVAAMERAGA